MCQIIEFGAVKNRPPLPRNYRRAIPPMSAPLNIPKVTDGLAYQADRFGKWLQKSKKAMQSVKYDQGISVEAASYFYREYGRFLKAGNINEYTYSVCRDLYNVAFVRGMEWQKRHAADGKEAQA